MDHLLGGLGTKEREIHKPVGLLDTNSELMLIWGDPKNYHGPPARVGTYEVGTSDK